MKRTYHYYLLAALLVGLLARLPGVFWGYNFPTGWRAHHVDEYPHLQNTKFLIHPSLPDWRHPYPKGNAAHVAVPMLVERVLEGQNLSKPPSFVKDINIIIAGRFASLLYGTASIFVLFLITRRLFQDLRVALFAAWIFALGGLHVTQSHFFLADVPSLFWFLLGTYLLLLDMGEPDKKGFPFLMGAAFCFGIAFGIKLVIAGLPTLAYMSLAFKPRVIRALYSGVFFLTGFVIINFGSYTPVDFFKTLTTGTSDPYQWSSWSTLFLYMIELPSIISFPILALTALGFFLLVKKFFVDRVFGQFWRSVIIILPLAINASLVVFKLDHFPRHLIPFIPWIAVAASYGLVKISDKLSAQRLKLGLLIALIFVYLAIFVFDGEKVFIHEPRNKAALWVKQNIVSGTEIYWRTPGYLEGYKHIHFPEYGRPPILVIQMDRANHYLSGMGLRNSYPEDSQYIFNAESQARIEGLQAVFKGNSEYREVIRFKEGYFMPEYVLVDNLIGNRSRNYVAEIVIFMNKG